MNLRDQIINVPTILLLFALILCSTMQLDAQDLFPVRQLTSDPAQEGFPTWSPRGDSLIYQHTDRYDTRGKNGLWKVALDGSGATQIFEGVGEHPKWSPDGQWVVFDADTGKSIKMIPVTGGEPIIFLPDSIGILHGGLPHWSPDASRIAFVEGTSTTLCVYDMESGGVKGIFQKDGLVPLPGGWTSDGKQVLVAMMEMPSRRSTIWTIPIDGSEPKQITGHCENFYRHLALSPDGKLLVYGCFEEGILGLYIMHLDGAASAAVEASAEKLASLPLVVSPESHNQGPIWSPDGNRIAFISGRSGSGDIYIMDLDMDLLRNKLEMAATKKSSD